MHELALATEVVRIICDEAARHGVERVVRYRVEVGKLRAVVPDLLRSGLEIAGQGTRAAGALVELVEIAGRARCSRCGGEYSTPDVLLVCPDCGGIGGEVLAGSELRVIELEGDTS
jgi:hydrogenase nickel incorporation protein HypA/HybF